MAVVDSAFNYWFDRFVLDHEIERSRDSAQAIARAAFAAGRAAQREDTRQTQAQGSEGVAVAQVWEDGAGERHIGWTVEDTDDYPPGTWLYVGGQNGKD